MPYHVRITTKSVYYDEVGLDLTEEELQERFLQPRRDGNPIVIGGRTIPADDLARIRITYTDESSEQLLPLIKAERPKTSIYSGPPDDSEVAKRGRDVTDQFIKGPPGGSVVPQSPGHPGPVADPTRVYVVHGRDAQVRDELFTFLGSIGLHPLEWAEAVSATRIPTPYIGQILDTAFSMAQAVVVLMTPDDEARLREPFWAEGDPPHETDLTPQARANVLFEAGMAMGRFPERTVLVEVGTLRPFSDIGGRHVIRLDDTTERRQELAHRLESAGCPVNLAGTDWHRTGDFAVRSQPAQASTKFTLNIRDSKGEKIDQV